MNHSDQSNNNNDNDINNKDNDNNVTSLIHSDVFHIMFECI